VSDALRWIVTHPVEIAVGIEFLAALVITVQNLREVAFLRSLRPLLPPGEDLPLYDALVIRAEFLMAAGLYLIVLTVIGATGVAIANAFPLIRVINGLIFLGILAGPIYLGRVMRRRPVVRDIAGDE
jgi:hypothetical protein